MENKELIAKLKNAQSWREAGVGITELIDALEKLEEENATLTARVKDLESTNRKLRSKTKGAAT